MAVHKVAVHKAAVAVAPVLALSDLEYRVDQVVEAALSSQVLSDFVDLVDLADLAGTLSVLEALSVQLVPVLGDLSALELQVG